MPYVSVFSGGSETSLMREAADRIEELEAQVSNLTNLNNSLSEQNATLLKRMDAAMNEVKYVHTICGLSDSKWGGNQ